MKSPKCPKCHSALGQTYYYDGYIEIPMLACECGFRIDCADWYDPMETWDKEYLNSITV